MMDEAGADEQITPEMEQTALRSAKDRANAAKWNLEIAIFLFAVLIIIIILLFEDVGVEIVAPVAIFGLSMVWLVGWRQGRQLLQRFYNEELVKLKRELQKPPEGTMVETIEESVQKALRERWR
jgi:hypothetical protein